MKQLSILFIGLAISLFGGQAAEVNTTAIEFTESTTADFGMITQNEPATHMFYFTNVSAKDVLVLNVKTSCGCTASNYTKTSIAAGKQGMVELTYNAARKGVFTKHAWVSTNDGGAPIKLTLKGEVK